MVTLFSRRTVLAAMLAAITLASAVAELRADPADPLPSWNDGPTKTSIIDFVTKVTKEGGPDYVAPAERIATFDNDGTLWVEQPIYTQFAFAIDRVRAMANKHPEWEPDIRRKFARRWVERGAQPGWYYQDSSGRWVQK